MIRFIAFLDRSYEGFEAYQCQSCGEHFFYSDIERHVEEVHKHYNWDIEYHTDED